MRGGLVIFAHSPALASRAAPRWPRHRQSRSRCLTLLSRMFYHSAPSTRGLRIQYVGGTSRAADQRNMSGTQNPAGIPTTGLVAGFFRRTR